LVVHNRYKQPGGEDAVVRAESALLAKMGHSVDLWLKSNDSISGPVRACTTALQSVYSIQHAREMQRRIREFRPDVVHIHNFFPILSPSIHIACRRAAVPVVQTLHNFRLLCPAAILRSPRGHRCDRCAQRWIPWPAFARGCYRGSHLASLAVANLLAIHRMLDTWNRSVSQFIALSRFAREKFVAGGIAAEKIAVKPNFVDRDPGLGTGRGGFALFVGRLTSEKGLGTLLDAWARLSPGPRLKIIGEGPLAPRGLHKGNTMAEIEWLGPLGREQVREAMSRATVLILPSTWFEAFPLVIAEAFAAGLPIIASRLGTMAEIITDGKNGMLFDAGDAGALARVVRWAFSHPYELEAMRYSARSAYERKYTAEVNYSQLMAIYKAAMSCSHVPASHPSELEAIG
jgi:glycosyltransferase involved in cell wall biosynthesis